MKIILYRTTIRADSILTTALIKYNGGYRIVNKQTNRFGVHYWTSLETTSYRIAMYLYNGRKLKPKEAVS